jgi:DNA-binding SARP family transcriptional activator
MLRLRLLGALALEHDEQDLAPPRAAAARAILAYLALHPGPQTRTTLSSRFWPDVLDESARQSLRNALWTLRRDLGPAADAVVTEGDTLRLADDVEVDARRLDAALARGDAAAAADLAERGTLLQGFEDEWALAAREERNDAVSAALAAEAAAAEDPATAVAWARRRARLDPLSEAATRDLMAALAAAGDGAAALTAYERLSDRLRQELRVAPSRATRDLAAAIREPDAEPQEFAEGQTLRRVLRFDPRRPVAGVSIPRAWPLHGRADELGFLLDECRTDAGGVVLLHGEAGIGKSRLVAELVHRCERRVAIGAGIDLEAAAPLAPWAELLDGLVDDDGDQPWRADLARLVPRLGALPVAPDRIRLHEAVVAAVADAGPLLLVLEDVHLFDDASLALLAHLGRRLTRLPVLLVATRRPARTDALEAVEDHLERAGAVRRRIGLGPLPDGDVGTLVRAANGALAPDEVRRTVLAAEGNPLLAVETARAALGGEPAPSLVAAVRSLLRGLSDGGRGVADLLAVAGRPLEAAEVDALPLAAPALGAAEGVGCGLLEGGGGEPAPMPLGFRHALLRDVTYNALEGPRRRLLHERVADAFIDAGAQPAEIARHLRRAGRDERAVEHLMRAAATARDLAALAEARAYAREAIDLRPDDPEGWLLLGHIEALRGRKEDMLAASAEALRLIGTVDVRRRGLALLERGLWLSTALCWPDEALRDFHAAQLLLEGQPGLDVDHARMLSASAWAEAVAGDPARVEALLAEAAAITPEKGYVAVMGVSARLNAMIRQDRAREALELADDLVAGIAHGGISLRLADYVWMEFAAIAAYVGEPERSLEFVDRYLTDNGGLLTRRIEGLAGRAFVLVRLGRFAEAVIAAEEMVRIADEIGADDTVPALCRHDLGYVLCEVGDHGRGVDLLGAALDADIHVSRMGGRLRRAESLVALGRLDDAAKELRTAVLTPLGPADQPETLAPRLARVQALIARARGDEDEARTRFDEAADGWRRLAGMDRREAYMANLVDLGRPPVAGLTEPARELERVLDERKESAHAGLR